MTAVEIDTEMKVKDKAEPRGDRRKEMDKKCFRHRREQWEAELLHPTARKSRASVGRKRPESPCPVRTAFQRDRDRILHSKPLRRLARKTQVFLNPEGDHYRTRMTHTLEVAQIARTIARALRLNEDLTEAIALAHDLGHTPFGHAGEAVLNRLLSTGFRHAEQSLREVDVLARGGQGLNLTAEVRAGILFHSKGKGPIIAERIEVDGELPVTVEAQVVRVADIVAYANHDMDDAVRGRVLSVDDVPETVWQVLGDRHSQRISHLIEDVLAHTNLDAEPRVRMSKKTLDALGALRDFLWDRLYENPLVHGQFRKATQILDALWMRFTQNPDEFFTRYWPGCPTHNREPIERAVADFLAGMTDRYAIRLFEELYLPRSWWVL
jgi:dGTPase